MNLKEIKEMIQLMNENSLTEFELEQEGLKVRLKKSSQGTYEQTLVQETRPVGGSGQGGHGAQTGSGGQKTEMSGSRDDGKSSAQGASAGKTNIKSPMVGTFYAAPAPEAQPFVQVGSVIEPGQVVCIIEAMKLMNEIKSEVKGKIVEILVHNGDPVEFGQPIFLLE